MVDAAMNVSSVDEEFLAETAHLEETLATRLNTIEAYLVEHNILGLWAHAVQQTKREFNMPGFDFWTYPAAHKTIDYRLSLDEDGDLLFEGRDIDGDHHSFVVPSEFLFLETRDEGTAILHQWLKVIKSNREWAAKKMNEAERQQNEAEFERLGHLLGRF